MNTNFGQYQRRVMVLNIGMASVWFLVMAFLLLFAISGCKVKLPAAKPERPPIQRQVDSMDAQVAAAQGSIGEAKVKLEMPEPQVPGAIKALVEASDQLKQYFVYSSQLREMNKKLIASSDTIVQQYEDCRKRVDEYEKMYVGPAAWRLWYWIVGGLIGSWLLLGVSTVYLPKFFGATGLAIAKSVVRFMPLANVFTGWRESVTPGSTNSKIDLTVNVNK